MWTEPQKNGKVKFVERYEDFMTGKSRKVSVTLDKDTAASRKLAMQALSHKIDAALGSSKKREITLKELVNKYRDDQILTVKKSTYTRNFHACNTILSILGENTIVERMTAQYIRSTFLKTKKPAGTLNEHLARLKSLIRWGFHNDYISDISFIDKIERFKDIPHKEKIQDKFLEGNELKELLNQMDVTPWRLLTKFLALSGLRFGEAAALTKRDVDISNSLIHVTKTYDSVNEETTSPKTLCSIRDVYMQEELNNVCKEINAYMLRQRLLLQYSSTLFLASKDGTHIKYYAYNKYLKETAIKVLKREITPHALRHTHASLLLEQGISIDTISRRLGHENSQITKEIYLHVTEKLKSKDNELLSQVKIM